MPLFSEVSTQNQKSKCPVLSTLSCIPYMGTNGFFSVRKHASDTGEFTSPPAVLGEPTDPESYKATLKAFVQIKGQVPLFRHGARWPKSLTASISSEGLAGTGCALAVSTGEEDGG